MALTFGIDIITDNTATEINTLDSNRHVIEITVNGNFNYESWENEKFISTERINKKDNRIRIIVNENRGVYSRDFGIILRNPCDREDIQYISFTQLGVEYIIGDEKHTFVKGYDNNDKETYKLEKLTRVYEDDGILTHTEEKKIELSVEGGSRRIYISGIYKYREIENEDAEEKRVIRLTYDEGIRTHIEKTEDDGIHNVVIESNGRPYSDNYDYFYVVRVTHYDNSDYYTDIEVRYKDIESSGMTITRNELHFMYNGDIFNGSTDTISIDTGKSEDCDWEITNLDELPSWITITQYPLYIVVSCSENLEENRECEIILDVNGSKKNIFVKQDKFDQYRIDPSEDLLVTFLANDVTSTTTVIVVSYGSPFKGWNEGDDDTKNGITLRCTGFFQNKLVYTYMFAIWAETPNTNNSVNEVEFILECEEGGKSKKIKVKQKEASVSQDPVTVQILSNTGHNTETPAMAEIIVPVIEDDGVISIPLVTAYSSAKWCQVELELDDTSYIAKIYVIEPNVFGMTRQCKVIFTNTNEPEKTAACVVKNTPASGNNEETGYDFIIS